jgi:hypothetical protein
VDEDLLQEALYALDVALVERLPNSTYFMLSQVPEWLGAVLDAAPSGSQRSLAAAMPFLDHFLAQAEAAWYDGAPARAESGPFAARVGYEDVLLRATALTLRKRALLVLERLSGDADARPILQKAREKLLEMELMTRRASAVHEPAANVQRLIGELSQMALPPDQRAVVEKLTRAGEALQTALAPLPSPPPKKRR